VDQDDKAAVELFQRAADGGLGDAWGNLGWMTENGHNGDKDFAKAAEDYRKGLSDSPWCNLFLGDLYRDGHGVAKDLSQARHYYQAALDLGSTQANDRIAALNNPATSTSAPATQP